MLRKDLYMPTSGKSVTVEKKKTVRIHNVGAGEFLASYWLAATQVILAAQTDPVTNNQGFTRWHLPERK